MEREFEEELGPDADPSGVKLVGVLPNEDGVSSRYIYAGLLNGQINPNPNDVSEVIFQDPDTKSEGKHGSHIYDAAQFALAGMMNKPKS